MKYLIPFLFVACGPSLPEKIEVVMPPPPAPCLCPACPVPAQPIPAQPIEEK